MEQLQPINKDDIINFLKSNKVLLEREFGVTKIALFGSYARGEQTAQSDIDLAIETSDFSFQKRCELKKLLEENLARSVDLCYFKGMRLFIRSMIEKDLIYV